MNNVGLVKNGSGKYVIGCNPVDLRIPPFVGFRQSMGGYTKWRGGFWTGKAWNRIESMAMQFDTREAAEGYWDDNEELLLNSRPQWP